MELTKTSSPPAVAPIVRQSAAANATTPTSSTGASTTATATSTPFFMGNRVGAISTPQTLWAKTRFLSTAG